MDADGLPQGQTSGPESDTVVKTGRRGKEQTGNTD